MFVTSWSDAQHINLANIFVFILTSLSLSKTSSRTVRNSSKFATLQTLLFFYIFCLSLNNCRSCFFLVRLFSSVSPLSIVDNLLLFIVFIFISSPLYFLHIFRLFLSQLFSLYFSLFFSLS